MNPNLSFSPIQGEWVEGASPTATPLIDYEYGGEFLGTSSSNASFLWMAECDGSSVWVSREGVDRTLVLEDVDISSISLAFDQTMNVHIAYVSNGVAKFLWWNSLSSAYETMTLTGSRTPRCCSDELNALLSADRDLILTYLRGSSLYVRLQRDRFSVEYEKVPNAATHEAITPTTRLVAFGRNRSYRLQWRFVH